jgi:uncharacterized protein (TIGR02145 family)
MKALINFLKRTHWFKISLAFLTCLLLLNFPSCQKDELDQGSVPDMDVLSSSALFPKGKISYGKVKDVEGNVYKTVKIGKQWWMAENLKTTKYSEGTSIPNVTGDAAWAALTAPGYCWYNDEEEVFKNTYGALYNFYTVDATSNGGKNVCPTGWHVPSDIEWHTLILYLDPDAKLLLWPEPESLIAAEKLKETGTTHWEILDEGATNESGFTAIPAGYRSGEIGLSQMVGKGCWWWSTDNLYRSLSYGGGRIDRGGYYKEGGFAVRCIKNK